LFWFVLIYCINFDAAYQYKMERDMVHSKSNHIALAEYFCSRETIPLLAGIALRVAYQTAVWNNRFTTRKALARLDHAGLSDVGMSLEQRAKELRKPFWRA
jgi:uncharacterized protein YjiS (DUF1127 family)